MLTEEDLSLRHLPEVSDYSISFQIPVSTLPKGEDLMADDNTFFEGTNNSILATPASFGRTTIWPPSLNFTSGPSVSEPSAARQVCWTVSLPVAPNPSVPQPELQAPPIHVMSTANRKLRRSDKTSSLKENSKPTHQDREESQEQHSCPSANEFTSTISHNMSAPPVFAEQSSLELRSAVRQSGPNLPHVESPLGSGPRATEEPTVVDTFEGPKEQTRPSALKDRPRASVSKKHFKRPTVVGGIMKSRKKRKTAAVGSEIGLGLTSVKPKNMIDSSIVDEPKTPGLNQSSLNPTGGTTKRLLTESREIMAGKNESTSSAAQDTVSVYPASTDNARLDGQETRDVNMNLDDLPGPAHASNSGDRDDERDRPLTVSQLSPRKRRAAQPSVVEQERDSCLSFPPVVSALEPASSSQASRKKRPGPVASTSRYGLRQRRNGHHSNALIPSPHPTDASTEDQSPTFASSSSAAPQTMEVCSNEMTADSVDVVEEIRGGREEVNEGNVGDIGHANIAPSSEMISTSECGSHLVETGSGSTATAKNVMKGPAGIGARIRTRKVSNISQSVNGGRTLRSRSVSNSVSARGGALRASERERRSVLVRARKEARRKDKVVKLDDAEKKSGSDGGNEGSSSGNKLKRSGMTYFASSIQSVQIEASTDRQIQARKGGEGRMTRSASSLSSSSGGGERSSKRKVAPATQTQSADQLHRKENVHPVIPQPFQWATEQRIQERRKFDDMMKEKVKEKEELEEHMRQEKEEKEEREVRELRKRAIPKANPVPEWYKGLPKKGEKI